MSVLRAELDALMAAARQSLEHRYGNQCEIAAAFDRDNPEEMAAIANYIRHMRMEGAPLHGEPPPLPHEMPSDPAPIPPIDERYAPRRR